MREKNTFRFKGIWTCHGRISRYHLGGCGRVNLYVSRYRALQPKTIDSRCRRCGKRRKFQPRRIEKRGGLRSVGFIWIPNGHELTIEEGFDFMEASQRNRDLVHGRFNQEEFVQASTLKKGGES